MTENQTKPILKWKKHQQTKPLANDQGMLNHMSSSSWEDRKSGELPALHENEPHIKNKLASHCFSKLIATHYCQSTTMENCI